MAIREMISITAHVAIGDYRYYVEFRFLIIALFNISVMWRRPA